MSYLALRDQSFVRQPQFPQRNSSSLPGRCRPQLRRERTCSGQSVRYRNRQGSVLIDRVGPSPKTIRFREESSLSSISTKNILARFFHGTITCRVTPRRKADRSNFNNSRVKALWHSINNRIAFVTRVN